MKTVIAYAVSGMHQIASQRKPFNPILGETYEGYWPDGTRIYGEHISHHPPITCYLVEHIDGLYTMYGSYEYTAKVQDLGNSIKGRTCGKNCVKFRDGSVIEFEYPFIKINGLMFGKRTTQYVGTVVFTDTKNNIDASF